MKDKHERIKKSISVIIPAFNEENSISAQVKEIKEVLSSHEITYEIIVVNDGSQDKTAGLALKTGARVLQHPDNRGYGCALKTGIMAAKHEAIVILDADKTYPADQIPELVAKLETADMVVGARTGKEVHIPMVRRPAKWILRWLAKRIAGQPIPDLNSGMRAFRREIVKQYFSILPNRFSFTTTITLALLADNYAVVFHPIDYYKRVGDSKIASWHFLDFMMLILRLSILFNPLKIFVPLSFGCALLGVLKIGYDIIAFFFRNATFDLSILYRATLSTSALLLIFVALQLLLIGLVTEGIVRRIALFNRSLSESHGTQAHELSSSSQTENAKNLS